MRNGGRSWFYRVSWPLVNLRFSGGSDVKSFDLIAFVAVFGRCQVIPIVFDPANIERRVECPERKSSRLCRCHLDWIVGLGNSLSFGLGGERKEFMCGPKVFFTVQVFSCVWVEKLSRRKNMDRPW